MLLINIDYMTGGQRQRVSLARAVYAESTIILLDDVLSAVSVFNRPIPLKCDCDSA